MSAAGAADEHFGAPRLCIVPAKIGGMPKIALSLYTRLQEVTKALWQKIVLSCSFLCIGLAEKIVLNSL